MVTDVNLILREAAEAIAEFCIKHHISRLSLFGSQLEGNADLGSDIDLLVVLGVRSDPAVREATSSSGL